MSNDMGKIIKNERIKKGLTQEELGEKLGVQKSVVAKYENGHVANMKRSKIELLAKIFDCSPAYLMGWEDNEVDDTTEQEKTLLKDFRLLNKNGKNKAVNTVNEMTFNPLYNQDYLKVIASHERTDIEVTDEMIKHDDDIMKDF